MDEIATDFRHGTIDATLFYTLELDEHGKPLRINPSLYCRGEKMDWRELQSKLCWAAWADVEKNFGIVRE